MEQKDLTKEYNEYLNSLENLNLKDFLKQFKELDSYTKKEEFLNKFCCLDIKNLFTEEFFKLFYVNSQASYIKEKLNLEDLDNLQTIVYCYNSNSREFNKKIEEGILNKELIEKGYVFNIGLDENSLKELNGLKITCVMDFNKLGLFGSFNKTDEKEGKFVWSDYQKTLMLIPKRSRTRGFLIKGRFYYKILKN